MVASKRTYLVILIILFLGSRLLFFSYPFWGLEYEDSFIFNDTGRYLAYDYDHHSMPYRCQSCIDGSYTNCYEYASFGGHLLTFSFILSGINWIFGYSYFNIFILNFAFSILIIIIVNWFSKVHKSFSFHIFAFLFALTPFISVFNTSGLSETFSSLFVVSFLLLLYQLNELDFRRKSISFWISMIVLIFACLVKRENALLMFFLCCIPIFRLGFKQKPILKSYIFFVAVSSVFLLILFTSLDLIQTVKDEEADIKGESTFKLEFLFLNLKLLFYAMMNFRYLGIAGLGFLIVAGWCCYKKSITKIGAMSLVLSFLYMILYSSHYRSYYQVIYQTSSPFEALRYLTNYFPLIAIFISSMNYNYILKLLKSKLSLFSLKVIILIFLLILSINVILTRTMLSKDEYYSRIQPVLETLKIANEKDFIITDIPIVFRCFSTENQKIINIFDLTQKRLEIIINTKHESSVYIVRSTENEREVLRYGINFNEINFERIEFNSNYYQLLKYSR